MDSETFFKPHSENELSTSKHQHDLGVRGFQKDAQSLRGEKEVAAMQLVTARITNVKRLSECQWAWLLRRVSFLLRRCVSESVSVPRNYLLRGGNVLLATLWSSMRGPYGTTNQRVMQRSDGPF